MFQNRSTSPSLACLLKSKRQTCLNSQANTGWTQGVLNAALLGEADMAFKMTMERAQVGSAVGYRFPAFAPHEQDFEPSADHYSNMNAALQTMLIQPADDKHDSILVFAAWPCDVDVSFKLVGPSATTVTASLLNGTIVEFSVQPAHRRKHVHVVQCAT